MRAQKCQLTSGPAPRSLGLWRGRGSWDSPLGTPFPLCAPSRLLCSGPGQASTGVRACVPPSSVTSPQCERLSRTFPEGRCGQRTRKEGDIAASPPLPPVRQTRRKKTPEQKSLDIGKRTSKIHRRAEKAHCRMKCPAWALSRKWVSVQKRLEGSECFLNACLDQGWQVLFKH